MNFTWLVLFIYLFIEIGFFGIHQCSTIICRNAMLDHIQKEMQCCFKKERKNTTS
jgi:hypothetical protein